MNFTVAGDEFFECFSLFKCNFKGTVKRLESGRIERREKINDEFKVYTGVIS